MSGQVAGRLPGTVTHWRGQATGRWWAMVPWPGTRCRARLIEAATEAALADEVLHTLRREAAR